MQRTQTNQDELKSKGNANGSPRYDTGTFPLYDREYNKAVNGSVILNDAKRANDFKYAGALNGLSGCRGSLYELQGIEGEEYYKRNGNKYKALIPVAKDQLKNVHADFKAFQKSELKAGNSLTPPKEWPEKLLNERLKAEVLLDVRRAELAKVQARIKKLTAEQRRKKKEAEKIFRFGLTGKSNDNQNISYTESGLAFIDDERSPYNGMTLFHYKNMVQDWLAENEITRADLNRRAKAYKQQMIDAGFKDEVPAMFTGKKFKDMMKRKEVWLEKPERQNWPEWDKWPSKPEWPEGVKPIDKLELEAEQQTEE